MSKKKKTMYLVDEDSLKILLYDSLYVEMLEIGKVKYSYNPSIRTRFIAEELDISEEEVYLRDLDLNDIVNQEIKLYDKVRR